jgi:hypothetical protein
MIGSAAEPSEPAMRSILPDARGHRGLPRQRPGGRIG